RRGGGAGGAGGAAGGGGGGVRQGRWRRSGRGRARASRGPRRESC
ncbi:cold-shock protein, partial [Burkholderia pseudomallei]